MFFFAFNFDKPAEALLSGNKGEWAEIYIFLKLLNDGKIYAADKNLNRLGEKFLKVMRIFREEIKSHCLEYQVGNPVVVTENCKNACPPIPLDDIAKYKDKVWRLISKTARGQISDEDTQSFLRKMCIGKLKSPSDDHSGFFGGTKDIVMEVCDYKSGLDSIVGFSCKSDFGGAGATLFNASADNTNFLYKIEGRMTDELAQEFNTTFDSRNGKPVVATARRMRFLKEHGCKIRFEKPVSDKARRNLMMCGGVEVPGMVGEMLRRYYYDGEGSSAYASVANLVEWLAEQDVCYYMFGDMKSMYRYKMAELLFAMFTGMRLGSEWDGRQEVTGGYIIAKNDGDVLAYHTCIADEFKDFLIERLSLEQPSHGRHHTMAIEKNNEDYFLKLPLQIRFNLKRD